jgi:hypothetical protein
MQASVGALMPQLNTLLVGGPAPFFNKGETGRAKTIFAAANLALYADTVRKIFTPAQGRVDRTRSSEIR